MPSCPTKNAGFFDAQTTVKAVFNEMNTDAQLKPKRLTTKESHLGYES